MKWLRIIAFSLCLSPLASFAMGTASSDPYYHIGVTSDTGYKVPPQLVEQVSNTIATRVTKDLSESAPELLTQASLVASRLTHNMKWICGGSIVGGIGAYLACQGISGFLDPNKNKNGENNKQYIKLTAIGFAIMGGAGWMVHSFLQ